MSKRLSASMALWSFKPLFVHVRREYFTECVFCTLEQLHNVSQSFFPQGRCFAQCKSSTELYRQFGVKLGALASFAYVLCSLGHRRETDKVRVWRER